MTVGLLFPGYALRPIAEAPANAALLVARLPRIELAWRDVQGRWWQGRPERLTGLRVPYQPTHWLCAIGDAAAC